MKSVLNVHWKDWCWSWNSNNLATRCEELTHLKRPWCWERLKAEGDDRGWDGWIASPTQWTWASVSSESWWWIRRPGVLQSMGHKELDMTEVNWTEAHLLVSRESKLFVSVSFNLLLYLVSMTDPTLPILADEKARIPRLKEPRKSDTIPALIINHTGVKSSCMLSPVGSLVTVSYWGWSQHPIVLNAENIRNNNPY